MTFEEILTQVHELLERQGRVSYRALKRRFELDDDYLEDVKAELIDAQRVAADEDGKVLIWTGAAGPHRAPMAITSATRCRTRPSISSRRSSTRARRSRASASKSRCCSRI